MRKEKSPESFEQAINDLEQIVAMIEEDGISLEAALEKYQTGMNLIKYCQNKLAEVEQKISILDNESNTLTDFNLE